MTRKSLFTILIILGLATTACSFGSAALNQLSTGGIPNNNGAQAPAAQATTSSTTGTAIPTVAPNPNQTNPTAAAPLIANGALSAYEATMEEIYAKVNPSVVNISVIEGATNGFQGNGRPSGALGSGFVWDKQGHIVTNNHVVSGATSISVTFSDGLTVPATVVGTDLNNDLAVVKVDVPAERLQPVTMADSTSVRVGQVAIAIGNPYGLQGSMSAGIISGLDRSLPVGGDNPTVQTGANYEIPDIIQTDAPINPGNSGGVLVNIQGEVLGVTAAIESASQSNSGVGFVIPSVIVQKVVPALIQTGHYDSPWLGISGTTMGPDFAKAMNLNSDQRGVLVVDVTAGGPAAKAGLRPSSQQTTVNGQQLPYGGDVIVAVDGKPVNTFNDLVTYLSRSTSVGQKITLNILRDGKLQSIEVTLEARPATTPSATLGQNNNNNNGPFTNGNAYMGIQAMTLDSNIIQAMGLPAGTQGVLVIATTPAGPASQAGIQGGTSQATINGNTIEIGGDVITRIDNTSITSIDDLHAFLANAQPGQTVTVNLLRGAKEVQVKLTLGSN